MPNAKRGHYDHDGRRPVSVQEQWYQKNILVQPADYLRSDLTEW